MSAEERVAAIQQWLRPESAPAYRAALEWLLPRCRTEEERALAPTLLLLLAPLNALVTPCRPVARSRVNFQVTLSRPTDAGPERVRLTVRAGEAVRGGGQETDASSPSEPEDSLPELWLDSAIVLAEPLVGTARAVETLLARRLRDSRD